MLDIKLYTFLSVLEHKSFTKTAEILAFTQPAVSHQINQLENDLGVKLFIRSKNGLILTPEGETVARYAKRFLAMYEKLKQDLNNTKYSNRTINVGLSHTAECNKISEVLALWGASRKGLKINLISDSSNKLLEMLENYQIDIAIVDEKPVHSFKSVLLGSDSLAFFVGNMHKKRQQDSIDIEELMEEKLVLRLPGSVTHSQLCASMEAKGLSLSMLNVILQIDNVSTIKAIVQKNIASTILPISVCTEEIKRGRLFPLNIKDFELKRQTSLIYNSQVVEESLVYSIVDTYKKQGAASL